MNDRKIIKILGAAAMLCALNLSAAEIATNEPIAIVDQGSFAVGGSVKTSEGKYEPVPKAIAGKSSGEFFGSYKASVEAGGQTLHGDHASVFYQVPANAKANPLVFLHGYGQSARSWMTTPDGREGFNNIFLRKGYSVYLLDQPRRGQAARSTTDATIKATPDEQFWFAQFRIGVYPKFNEGAAFPKDEASLDQFFRQMTPDTGSFDIDVITDSTVKLFEKIGGGVFVTHSASGIIGWTTAMKTDKVKAVVAFEPGGLAFPEGETPEKMQSRFGDLAPVSVPKSEFEKLTKIPIAIYFGDFIPDKMDGTQGGESWYMRFEMSKKFVDTINCHGGKATLVHLPKIGIKGNTHFLFSDLNNKEIAQHLADWLKQNGLDK